ncbi:uncharacterized protein LOC128236429 [Mya arenaria]|uniref:uncharacterized protein LOC128236429 n=1 Tax=Mya arenaria TaxID=6604 RepID=UPI0022DEB7B1|nr:uncharacterized protein LOC128236429 [Mya arenaria]
MLYEKQMYARDAKLVKESDGDEKNCGKKRQQPASSKGKGQKKQKTLAVKTRKSPRKRIQEEEGGASGTEGGQSEISDAESMASRASQASKSSQSKPTSSSKSKSSSASASRRAVDVPIEEITQDQM